MYVYYILRSTQDDKTIEVEGDIIEEQFPGIDLTDALATINCIVQKAREEGHTSKWDACELTDSIFEHEDSYIYIDDRWMRRSSAPWRKDKFN